VAAALAELKIRDPGLRRAVVKLNYGFSGEGNAVFDYDGCPGSGLECWIATRLPERLAIEAPDFGWERYAAKLAETGGIAEAWVSGAGARSPSVQLRVTPVGELELISTHEQILGGPSGQVFQACTFPAETVYVQELQQLAVRAGEVLRRRGVLGRFGVDFISVPQADGWRHVAIEVNLRKGGTTHTYQMLQFLTQGRYDPARGEFLTPGGRTRCYYATDTVLNPAYRQLTATDLFEIAGCAGAGYDERTETGVVFTLVGALSQYGKLGVVAIDADREAARRRFCATIQMLDRETAG